MNKTIIGFIAGQALQLGFLIFATMLTYTTNTVLVCAILGGAATFLLMVGVVLERVEQAQRIAEMEEAAPIPKEIKVTNDKVEKESDAPKEGPKSGSNAQRPEKKITVKLEGGSPLMAKTLEEAMK